MRTEASTLTYHAGLRVADDIADLVGHTPMLRLTRLASPHAGEVFAKLEFLNPGGSVKDRAALGMILRAEEQGLLRPGAEIFEATAGNTGVGLALIGVNRGYKVTLFVPEGYAEEKCILMRAFGATVIRTSESSGMLGAIEQAKSALAATPGSWGAFQFENEANPDFHEETTAAEIWQQMDERVDAIVSGVGSGGTFSGLARGLKKRNPKLVAIAVETEGSILQGGPPGPHRVEGIGVSFIPRTFHPELADDVLMITDEEAFAMVKRMAAEEGLLGGSSAGAIVAAALEVARRLGPGKRVATIVPDSAERYLSKNIFDGGR